MSALLTKPGDKRVARGQANRRAREFAAKALVDRINLGKFESSDELLAFVALANHLRDGKAICDVSTEHLKEALEYMRRTQPKEQHLKAIYAARFRAVEYELGVRQ